MRRSNDKDFNIFYVMELTCSTRTAPHREYMWIQPNYEWHSAIKLCVFFLLFSQNRNNKREIFLLSTERRLCCDRPTARTHCVCVFEESAILAHTNVFPRFLHSEMRNTQTQGTRMFQCETAGSRSVQKCERISHISHSKLKGLTLPPLIQTHSVSLVWVFID